MLSNTLRKSDPVVESVEEAAPWVDFNSDYGNREKITVTGGHEEELRRKRNKDKFSRVSRKMSDLTEFTQKKTPGRTDAFRFHAVDRSDAFKNPSYYPEEPAMYKTGTPLVPYAISVASDQKSTASEVLEKVELDLWMGFNQQPTAMTPAPSDAPESMRSAKSVTDLQGLDQHPAVTGDVGDKEERAPIGTQRTEETGKVASVPPLQEVPSTSVQPTPWPLPPTDEQLTPVPEPEPVGKLERPPAPPAPDSQRKTEPKKVRRLS